MKHLIIFIPFFFLVDSCNFPVSIEENNTVVECENTRLVKNFLLRPTIRRIHIYMGIEFIGSYDEFKLSDNYLRVTDDYGYSTHFYLCEMVSAYVSGSYLYLTF